MIVAEPCGQLDPQSLVSQSVGVLIGGPLVIAGKYLGSFAAKSSSCSVGSNLRRPCSRMIRQQRRLNFANLPQQRMSIRKLGGEGIRTDSQAQSMIEEGTP